MGNEFYIKPKMLDFKNIRRHEDLKLILPFIEVRMISYRSAKTIQTRLPTELCSAIRNQTRPS
jgi:hypothetical protein